MFKLDDRQVHKTSESILNLVLGTTGSSIDDKARKQLLDTINSMIKAIIIMEQGKMQEIRFGHRRILFPDGYRGSTGKVFRYSPVFPKIRAEKLFMIQSKRQKSGKSSIEEDSFPGSPSNVCGE